MDADAYLASLTADADALAAAAAGNLGRAVPTCAGWTVADLVAHTGRVHRRLRTVLATGGPPDRSRTWDVPEGEEALLAWFREGAHELVADLASRDPGDWAWTAFPVGSPTVGWWRRRQALELAVHLFDTRVATGEQPAPLPAALAMDGIDELLVDLLPPVLARKPVGGLTGTLHLHATDTPGEWFVDFGAGAGPVVRAEHAKADTALRGPASGLYLWLWNRQEPAAARLEVFGSTEIVSAWRDVSI